MQVELLQQKLPMSLRLSPEICRHPGIPKAIQFTSTPALRTRQISANVVPVRIAIVWVHLGAADDVCQMPATVRLRGSENLVSFLQGCSLLQMKDSARIDKACHCLMQPKTMLLTGLQG